MIIRNRTSFFAESLIIWFETNKRDLPWRVDKNPFRVWLSEVILQQTRVSQGTSYFEKFVHQYDNVHALAEADEEEVLRLWEGLGYYSRARNMLAAARQVASEFNGEFPSDLSGLKSLKGVGPYTAAAIGSICFDLEEPVLDGNAFRVAARFFGIDLAINLPSSTKTFYTTMKEAMQGANPGTFNQAVMEVGALVCLPAKPKCQECPLHSECYANRHNKAHQLPVKNKKNPPTDVYMDFAVVRVGNKILFHHRSRKGIWKNMWDFPSVEGAVPSEYPDAIIKSELATELHHLTLVAVDREVLHQLTHRRLHIRFGVFLSTRTFEPPKDCRWLTIDEAESLPMPVPVRHYVLTIA